MKIIAPSARILAVDDAPDILGRLEFAGRICYKSEENITADSAVPFLDRIVRSGHHSVIEHASATAHIICDRGVSHELVRHRLASFSQESTRYADYSGKRFGREITVIRPCFWPEGSPAYMIWLDAVQRAEAAYFALRDAGVAAQQARSVLPNSLKTEIVITCNMREWRHIFELRCAPAAHPQMREVMLPLLRDMNRLVPALFADLYAAFERDIPETASAGNAGTTSLFPEQATSPCGTATTP
ncbi:MAG: FAD-dependent thymidylate synthase [Desulfovibrio sp.]|jgi:thymidylate synthase (FAD)|nr:FAD-dependent thymidylate synthase [Desulfovibrio sp.]